MTLGMRHIAAIATAVLLIGPALAQHGSATDDNAPDRAERGTPIERESLRSRLETRLERLRTEEQRIEEALAKLDAGEPVSRVRSMIPPTHTRPEAGGPVRGDRSARNDPAFDADSVTTDGTDTDGGADANAERAAQRMLRYLRQQHPDAYERFAAYYEEDPEGFVSMMRDRRSAFFRQLVEAYERDEPAVIDLLFHLNTLELDARNVARRIAGSDDAQENESLRKRLRGIVEQQVDTKLDIGRLKIVRMADQVELLGGTIDEQAARRESLVEERVRALIENGARDGGGTPMFDEGGGSTDGRTRDRTQKPDLDPIN